MAVLYEGAEKAVCSNFCARISPAPAVESRFLAYVFAAAYGQGLTQCAIKQTTGIQNLDAGAFFSSPWAYPGLEEQRRIADFLDAETSYLDLLVAKRDQQLGLLKRRRFSLVREVLMSGLRGAQAETTDLGWLPKHPADWSLVPLRYISQCLDGRRIPLSAQERSLRQGPYPYYGASRVVDHIDDYLFDEPLVLLGEDGAQLGNPNLEVSFFAEGKIWVNNHAHVLRPTGIDGRLLAEILNVFDRELCMSGATREKITQEGMNGILVPVPPQDQQSELVEWISAEQAKRNRLEVALRRQLSLLAERRQALITAAVTGQFDVSTASGRNVTDGVSA